MKWQAWRFHDNNLWAATDDWCARAGQSAEKAFMCTSIQQEQDGSRLKWPVVWVLRSWALSENGIRKCSGVLSTWHLLMHGLCSRLTRTRHWPHWFGTVLVLELENSSSRTPSKWMVDQLYRMLTASKIRRRILETINSTVHQQNSSSRTVRTVQTKTHKVGTTIWFSSIMPSTCLEDQR